MPPFFYTKPWHHHVSQDLAVRDAFEAAPQGVALGMSSQYKGAIVDRIASVVVADLQPIFLMLSDVYVESLWFMIRSYDYLILFADDGYR